MISIRYLKTTVILAIFCWVTFDATVHGAEKNVFLEACKTFDGAYQERREGCDPDCVVTYICGFDDGSGRFCDDKGSCGPLNSKTTGAAANSKTSKTAADSSAAPESGNYVDRADCFQSEQNTCRDQCSNKTRRKTASCIKSCLEDICGDY